MRGQCLERALAYLGSMSPPWGYGFETMRPESWAAGTRHVHCFVGHIAEDGAWVESTGRRPGAERRGDRPRLREPQQRRRW